MVDDPFTVKLASVSRFKSTVECIIDHSLLLLAPLQIDSGLMTPTMKIRRDRVVSLYQAQIDNLYKGTA